MATLHQVSQAEAEIHHLDHTLLQVEDQVLGIQVEVVEQGLLVHLVVVADPVAHREVVVGNNFVSKG